MEVVDRFCGKRRVALANPPPKELPSDVAVRFLSGSGLKDIEVGPAIYVNFMPEALRDGSSIVALDAEVVGKGLESIQGGLDLLKKGVSVEHRSIVETE